MTITATSDNQIRKSNIRNWTIGLQTFATGSLPRSGLVQQQLRTVEAPTVKEFDLRTSTGGVRQGAHLYNPCKV